jgi:hypothetical protein
LGIGYWVLGYWVIGYWVIGLLSIGLWFGVRMEDSGFQVHGLVWVLGFGLLGFGYWVLGFGFWFGVRMEDSGFQVHGLGYWVIGYLVLGY